MSTEQQETDRLERQSVLDLAATAVGIRATVAFFVLGSLAEAGAL